MTEVRLKVYDLSMGMARTMSGPMLGTQIDLVPHTGIEVFGYEFFYGGGVQEMKHEDVVRQFGLRPCDDVVLGTTTVTRDSFLAFLDSNAHRFTQDNYHILNHNCNHFSDECAKFLLDGVGIPQDIVNLPQRVMETPLGSMIMPMFDQMQARMADTFVPFNHPSDGTHTSHAPQTSQPPPSASTASAPNAAPSSVQLPPMPTSTGNDLVLKIQQGESTFEVTVGTADSVVTLKKVVYASTGFAPFQQRLLYSGRVLADSDVLGDIDNLSSGSVVHLVPNQGATRISVDPRTGRPSLIEALQALKASAPLEARVLALKTLKKVIENVQAHPDVPKYRRLKKSNAVFRKRVSDVAGSTLVLRALGFEEENDANGVAFYVLKDERAMGLGKRLIDVAYVGAKQSADQPASSASASASASATNASATSTSQPPQSQSSSARSMLENAARSNPMLSSALNNPELMRSVLDGGVDLNDPRLRAAVPESMRGMLDTFASNPGALQSMIQSVMGNGESLPPANDQPPPAAATAAAGNSDGSAMEDDEEADLQEAIRRSLEGLD